MKYTILNQRNMIFTTTDTHFLIAAIVIISSALVFYTIGVWGEKFQHQLKGWHLLFFILGLIADTAGTTLMAHIARLTGVHDMLHTITGFIAIILMLIHASWALFIYFKGDEQAKQHFHRFSIFVWCIWLIPYFIVVYICLHSHM